MLRHLILRHRGGHTIDRDAVLLTCGLGHKALWSIVCARVNGSGDIVLWSPIASSRLLIRISHTWRDRPARALCRYTNDGTQRLSADSDAPQRAECRLERNRPRAPQQFPFYLGQHHRSWAHILAAPGALLTAPLNRGLLCSTLPMDLQQIPSSPSSTELSSTQEAAVPAEKEKKKKKKKSYRSILKQVEPQLQPMVSSPSREELPSDKRLVLNIGGRRFETLSSTLRKYPHSLLGTMFDPRNDALLKPDERGEVRLLRYC